MMPIVIFPTPSFWMNFPPIVIHKPKHGILGSLQVEGAFCMWKTLKSCAATNSLGYIHATPTNLMPLNKFLSLIYMFQREINQI